MTDEAMHLLHVSTSIAAYREETEEYKFHRFHITRAAAVSDPHHLKQGGLTDDS
jgi:hypothetical protein